MKLYNSTDSQVVLDNEGHAVGGYEWVDAPRTEFVHKAIEHGRLIEVDGDLPEGADVITESDSTEPDDNGKDKIEEPGDTPASKRTRKSAVSGTEKE